MLQSSILKVFPGKILDLICSSKLKYSHFSVVREKKGVLRKTSFIDKIDFVLLSIKTYF